jgi:hypothetical protein
VTAIGEPIFIEEPARYGGYYPVNLTGMDWLWFSLGMLAVFAVCVAIRVWLIR